MTTDLQEAKKAVWKMAVENNEANNSEGKYKWTMKAMKRTFYYGEHTMQDVLTKQLEDYNGYYLLGTGYKMVADGLVQTSWSRKDDMGLAVLKFKLVKS